MINNIHVDWPQTHRKVRDLLNPLVSLENFASIVETTPDHVYKTLRLNGDGAFKRIPLNWMEVIAIFAQKEVEMLYVLDGEKYEGCNSKYVDNQNKKYDTAEKAREHFDKCKAADRKKTDLERSLLVDSNLLIDQIRELEDVLVKEKTRHGKDLKLYRTFILMLPLMDNADISKLYQHLAYNTNYNDGSFERALEDSINKLPDSDEKQFVLEALVDFAKCYPLSDNQCYLPLIEDHGQYEGQLADERGHRFLSYLRLVESISGLYNEWLAY